ncbi:hypothetical protein [Clostridium isatidis]|uniref:Uncharacterized protein n=1 Tax=Clostridium isatidis TaxID=182773 RepID=A0A343JDN9_9CLOT|nr:hypothetical protein [Clostridium isatidis]ASW43647.1 hypothetical protein BEN51_09190 [Clostridium isatidis]NLZ34029.1 hypothetical protein [Clostridiales bacterium]
MQNLFIIIIISVLAESIWETLKMVWQDGKLCVDKVGALVISIIITISTDLDIFELLKINNKIPYLGIILTGILVSRGSNFVHDLIVKLTNNITKKN